MLGGSVIVIYELMFLIDSTSPCSATLVCVTNCFNLLLLMTTEPYSHEYFAQDHVQHYRSGSHSMSLVSREVPYFLFCFMCIYNVAMDSVVISHRLTSGDVNYVKSELQKTSNKIRYVKILRTTVDAVINYP
ncbi:hypothetical protein GUJ93_ZPchr0014g47540 [Zizania palustris]|uniref:Uncharacterized protein n=1 Tax=Zizania palustris TaxID=103762 RepID=A0A8J5SWJ0_ZIZPA|nr:hypothetical protein GUJ93_ZPchr0014g47540 [Zizania palustris]